MLRSMRMKVWRIALVALLLLTPSLALAAPGDDAAKVVDRWAAAFSADDPSAVVSCYAPDATLLGTESPVLTQGTDAIRAYFTRILTGGSSVKISERHVVPLGKKSVLVFGFYEFTFHVNGQPVPAPARFSMVLSRDSGAWLIVHQHSSVLPKPPQ
jgi:uncharacterized protein (TIGR02246 family)